MFKQQQQELNSLFDTVFDDDDRLYIIAVTRKIAARQTVRKLPGLRLITGGVDVGLERSGLRLLASV